MHNVNTEAVKQTIDKANTPPLCASPFSSTQPDKPSKGLPSSALPLASPKAGASSRPTSRLRWGDRVRS